MELDVTLIYGIRFMQLILASIQLWMEELEMLSQNKFHSKDTSHWVAMERSYLNILKTFEHFKAIYQSLILLKSTGFFIRALLYLQIIMEILNLETENGTIYLGTISKIAMFSNEVKDFGLLFHVCVECEVFYLRINDVSTLASVTRNREGCPEILRKLCKNVTRLNSMPIRMTACSVFTVDAAFPLRLLAVVTTYSLVLLQFNTSNLLIQIC
ncbi:hypothetical protein evm_003182 [Chilo suppressalis]|nr:hypothetical protein evm_003182 [Chilo suppressalis]